jgi:hypothetical protein
MPKETALYGIKKAWAKGNAQAYAVTKFDEDLNPLQSYTTIEYTSGYLGCDCPGGRRPECRHRKMLPEFKKNAAIDKFIFLNFDTGKWYDPKAEEGLSGE